LLGDKVGYVRSEAALALGKIGADAKAAVPRLIELMKDADEGVRLASALPSATWVGGEAAVPTLLEAQNIGTPKCGDCPRALNKIGPAAIPELTEALRSDNAHHSIDGGIGPGDVWSSGQARSAALLAVVKDKYWALANRPILRSARSIRRLPARRLLIDALATR